MFPGFYRISFLFFPPYIYLFVCVCRSEGNLQELVFSLFHVDLKDWTQVLALGWTCLSTCHTILLAPGVARAVWSLTDMETLAYVVNHGSPSMIIILLLPPAYLEVLATTTCLGYCFLSLIVCNTAGHERLGNSLCPLLIKTVNSDLELGLMARDASNNFKEILYMALSSPWQSQAFQYTFGCAQNLRKSQKHVANPSPMHSASSLLPLRNSFGCLMNRKPDFSDTASRSWSKNQCAFLLLCAHLSCQLGSYQCKMNPNLEAPKMWGRCF